MTSLTNQNLLRTLYAELADIERQQEDTTLSHSDQQLLDQAWEDVSNHIDELEDIIASEHKEDEDQWRDGDSYFNDDEEDSRPATPVPAEPVRFAPPPPPLSATRRPPPIEIPVWAGSPSMAPPPPRPGGARICNCDSDGQCAYCEEEELERWNNMVDDRRGCEYCSGCIYCQEGGGYDGADEV